MASIEEKDELYRFDFWVCDFWVCDGVILGDAQIDDGVSFMMEADLL